MRNDTLQETLLRVRRLLLDLERHLDRAAEGGGESEIARAWARSAQVEQALREAAPAEAREIAEAEEGVDRRVARDSVTPPAA